MTLDDLLALNEEIAALVRSGVPLEAGLAAIGSDMPGRLGQTATAWAERAARGESLDQAILQDAGSLPPAYRAVIQAGLRAGRLPAALEAVATSARRLIETRRAVMVAVLYPLLVLLVAWGCAFFFTRTVAPTLAVTFRSFHVPGYGFVAALVSIGRWGWYWVPVFPILVALFLAMWWTASARAGTLHSRAVWPLGWLPWVGPMLRWSQTAAFLDILALLIENHTPLEEAVLLAGDASGDPQTVRIAQQLATTLRQGKTRPAQGEPAFPPLITWLMLAAGRDGALLPALSHAASAYHRRARHQSELLRVFLPVALTVVVCGSVTAVFALSLFIPYATMLRTMSLGA
jgi:type II secretory pathway component PulF